MTVPKYTGSVFVTTKDGTSKNKLPKLIAFLLFTCTFNSRLQHAINFNVRRNFAVSGYTSIKGSSCRMFSRECRYLCDNSEKTFKVSLLLLLLLKVEKARKIVKKSAKKTD